MVLEVTQGTEPHQFGLFPLFSALGSDSPGYGEERFGPVKTLKGGLRACSGEWDWRHRKLA